MLVFMAYTHNRLMALCPKETFTHSHPSCSSDILYQLPPSTTIYSQACKVNKEDALCSIYVLGSPSPQPLSRSCLVFLLVWDPLLHSCISSPNHHLLFVTHAHTIRHTAEKFHLMVYSRYTILLRQYLANIML